MRRARPLGDSRACWWICPDRAWRRRFRIFTTRAGALPRCKRPLRRTSSTARPTAKGEIQFARKQEKIVDVILHGLAKGKIPERITHNDTKFNNVMLDIETGKAMCVVDLDTVMPGCVLYDFGDMVRTTTSPTLEDELDLSKVQMQMPMFKSAGQGLSQRPGRFLTKAERRSSPFPASSSPSRSASGS